MFTRRQFMAASAAALANQLFAAPADSKAPNVDLEKLGAVALSEAKKFKATYADIRIVRLRDQRVGTAPLAGTGHRQNTSGAERGGRSSFGFGVRVIVNGAWGFASSPHRDTGRDRARHGRSRHHRQGQCHHPAQARRTGARESVSRPLGDASRERPVHGSHGGETGTAAAQSTEEVKKNPKVFGSAATLESAQRGQVLRLDGRVVDPATHPADLRKCGRDGDRRQNGISRTRNYTPTQASAGWEYVPEMNLEENATRIREEVVEHLRRRR